MATCSLHDTRIRSIPKDGDVAEKAPQAVLVDDCLLQEAVARAARDELVEFAFNSKNLILLSFSSPSARRATCVLPEPLSTRLVHPEGRLQDAPQARFRRRNR